jgi:hypothetical protein
MVNVSSGQYDPLLLQLQAFPTAITLVNTKRPQTSYSTGNPVLEQKHHVQRDIQCGYDNN